MGFITRNPEDPNPIPPEQRVCIVRDWINYKDAPKPTLMEILAGPDMFIGAPKFFTPEQAGATIKRFAGRFLPLGRRTQKVDREIQS